MEVQRESLPGPSTLASASAGSTQDDCEYAESIDSDEHDLESEGSRSSEPVITAASILTQPRCPPASQLAWKRRLKVKAARYFSPYKVHELRPTAGDLDSLKSFPFFDQEIIDGLKSELPSYFAAAEDVSEQVDAIGWWNGHKSNLPKWASAFKLLILVQPSSAAAERVFSLLTSSFTKQQESSLEDYIQLSIMLQYNSQS